VTGRFVVTLRNPNGSVVSTCDFATEPEALEYMRQAVRTAKAIGGKAEMDPPVNALGATWRARVQFGGSGKEPDR
jgi:hypothetical protein